jgi:hypothetical protein
MRGYILEFIAFALIVTGIAFFVAPSASGGDRNGRIHFEIEEVDGKRFVCFFGDKGMAGNVPHCLRLED